MSLLGNPLLSAAFVTDTFNGNGSTTSFTLSVAPATTSSCLVAISGVLQDPSAYSVVGTTMTFSSAPPTGAGNISVRYLGIPASNVATTAYRTVTEFTATAGQTAFSVPSYTPGYIDVYRNGVRLGAADFTATNGVSMTLAAGAAAGDLVVTESFYVSSVLNAIPSVAGAVNESYLLTGAVTQDKLGAGSVAASKIASGQTFGLNGIKFPATQVSSSDVNTLDDYEEGTFTPVLVGSVSNPTVSYSVQYGAYIKIGRVVYCRLAIDSNITVAGSGSIYVNGLPFVASSGNYWQHTRIGFYNSSGQKFEQIGIVTSDARALLYTTSDVTTNAATTGINTFQCNFFYLTEV